MVTPNRGIQTISTHRQLPTKTLCHIHTLTLTIAHQDPLRSAVTWRFSNCLLYGQAQTVAHQHPLLQTHLDPGICQPRSTMTWRFANFLLHGHTQEAVYQYPPLYTRFEPGNCQRISVVTWRVSNLFLHDHQSHAKIESSGGFLFPAQRRCTKMLQFRILVLILRISLLFSFPPIFKFSGTSIGPCSPHFLSLKMEQNTPKTPSSHSAGWISALINALTDSEVCCSADYSKIHVFAGSCGVFCAFRRTLQKATKSGVSKIWTRKWREHGVRGTELRSVRCRCEVKTPCLRAPVPTST